MSTSKTRSARVAPLASAFAKSDLTRLAVSDGEFSLELVRRSIPAETAKIQEDASRAAAPVPVAAASEAGPIRDTIRAELVGILRYVDPRPSVGMQLDRERDLFVIEALGVRTPVAAAGKGIIVELFVNDGSPVEYGQPLLVIERV